MLSQNRLRLVCWVRIMVCFLEHRRCHDDLDKEAKMRLWNPGWSQRALHQPGPPNCTESKSLGDA